MARGIERRCFIKISRVVFEMRSQRGKAATLNRLTLSSKFTSDRVNVYQNLPVPISRISIFGQILLLIQGRPRPLELG